MKNKKLWTSLSLVSLLGATAVGCASAPYESYVTVDINPSIGFVVNEKNQILSAQALNQDGEMLLLQVQITNQSLETGLANMIKTAVQLGYIDTTAEETLIQVDVAGKSDAIQSMVQTAVQSKLQKAMDLWDLGVSLQKRAYTTDETQAALALGITPLQNRLMEMARFGDTTVDETALRAMNGEELAKHIREHQETINEIATSLRATLQSSMETIKSQFQEQIQTLQGQVDAIRNQGGNTATVQASLDAVKLQLRTMLQAAMQELATQTEALRTQLNTQYQARLDQYEAIVNAYKQAHGIE